MKAVVSTYIQLFADCSAIRDNIVLPTLTFGTSTYNQDFQMGLLDGFTAVSGADYCGEIYFC